MRYRTQGGGVVTWTPTPNEHPDGMPKLTHFGHLSCSGCRADHRLTRKGDANAHAQKCHAIP